MLEAVPKIRYSCTYSELNVTSAYVTYARWPTGAQKVPKYTAVLFVHEALLLQ